MQHRLTEGCLLEQCRASWCRPACPSQNSLSMQWTASRLARWGNFRLYSALNLGAIMLHCSAETWCVVESIVFIERGAGSLGRAPLLPGFPCCVIRRDLPVDARFVIEVVSIAELSEKHNRPAMLNHRIFHAAIDARCLYKGICFGKRESDRS